MFLGGVTASTTSGSHEGRSMIPSSYLSMFERISSKKKCGYLQVQPAAVSTCFCRMYRYEIGASMDRGTFHEAMIHP